MTACSGRQFCQLGWLCRRYSRLCRPNVECPFDFVASVYGAKATRPTLLTFDKVHRVEFNLVAGVYRAVEAYTEYTTLTSKNSKLCVSYPCFAVGKEHLRLMQSCIRYNCTWRVILKLRWYSNRFTYPHTPTWLATAAAFITHSLCYLRGCQSHFL